LSRHGEAGVRGTTVPMETTHSDVGYPEEQPGDVGDETTRPERPRKGGQGEGNSPETESGDGKATGNPDD
jgi:hypothetical protein